MDEFKIATAATRRKIHRRHSAKYIGFDAAVQALHHRHNRLVRLQTADGPTYFIAPRGGRVLPMVAEKIIARADVVAGADALFPGVSVTWRRLR